MIDAATAMPYHEGMAKWLTTKEAAERLDVNEQRIRVLAKSGKLPAQKFGWAWMIAEDDLQEFLKSWDRKPGRRPKIGA